MNGFIKINGKTLSLIDAYVRYPEHAYEIFSYAQQQKKIVKGNDKLSKLNNKSKVQEIKKAVDELILKLNLVKSNDDYKNFENIFKVFNYIVKNSLFDERIMKQKQNIANANLSTLQSMTTLEINDIYNCLIRHRSVCTSDAYAMSFILRCIGIDSYHVTVYDKESEKLHEVVLINLGSGAVYCDPSLYRDAIQAGFKDGVRKDDFLYDESEYLTYLKQGNRAIKCIYPPIKFVDGGDMAIENFHVGDEENE